MQMGEAGGEMYFSESGISFQAIITTTTPMEATAIPTTADPCLEDRLPSVAMSEAEADPCLALPAPVGPTTTIIDRGE